MTAFQSKIFVRCPFKQTHCTVDAGQYFSIEFHKRINGTLYLFITNLSEFSVRKMINDYSATLRKKNINQIIVKYKTLSFYAKNVIFLHTFGSVSSGLTNAVPMTKYVFGSSPNRAEIIDRMYSVCMK